MGDPRSVVAACNTDSIVVPCDGIGSSFDCPGAPGGGLRHLTPNELQGILDSFRPLGIHWKIEVQPTTALVIGINKVFFGHQEPDGSWAIDRPTDTGGGGHVADASDTPGRLLPDGHWAWFADLLVRVLAAVVDRGGDMNQPLPLPDDLPWWAYERPVLRRFRASRWSSLSLARKNTGDSTIAPYATYLRAETGGDGPAPVALGPGWDPKTWRALDWRVAGERVGIEVLTPRGLYFVGGDPNAPRFVVRSVADCLAQWLLPDEDPSVE